MAITNEYLCFFVLPGYENIGDHQRTRKQGDRQANMGAAPLPPSNLHIDVVAFVVARAALY